MMTKKRKWIFWLVLLIHSIILTVLWWMVIGFQQDYQSIPSSHFIGNKPSAAATLKEEGFPFSFLVIGDTHGRETAETLIRMALTKERYPFMVILGDFVKKPDLWNHRFFLTEMTTEIKPPFPVFLVPGNHDIDYASKIKSKERRVTPEVYESLYGSRNFDFIFNESLFIICGIDWSNPKGYLNYLRDTLLEKSKGKRHIFIFIHSPPKGLAGYIDSNLPGEEEFFLLLENYQRLTCFFGDYHGHWRGQRGGVNLIVSGGGGRLKESQPEWGKFNHILRIVVDRDKISEEIITCQGQIDLEDKFEEFIFTTVFPIIQSWTWILYSIFVLLLTISGFLLVQFLKTLWHG